MFKINIKKIIAIAIIASSISLVGCDRNKGYFPPTLSEMEKTEKNYLETLSLLDYADFIQKKDVSRQVMISSSHVNIIQHYAILDVITNTPEKERINLENLKLREILNIYQKNNDIEIPYYPIESGYKIPLFFFLKYPDLQSFSKKTIPEDKYLEIITFINKNRNDTTVYNKMLKMNLEQIWGMFYILKEMEKK